MPSIILIEGSWLLCVFGTDRMRYLYCVFDADSASVLKSRLRAKLASLKVKRQEL